MKCRKVKELQKTHWLIIIGDFNARKTKWGDRDNRRGAMLENLSASLGLARISPAGGEQWTYSATHRGSSRRSICDHALVDQSISGRVRLRVEHAPRFGSDHSRLVLEIDTERFCPPGIHHRVDSQERGRISRGSQIQSTHNSAPRRVETRSRGVKEPVG